MNIILTSACNKNCSFCFAKEYVSNPEKEIFDLQFVKNLISEAGEINSIGNVKINKFQLLGGEPTKYPHFKELMKWMTEIAIHKKENNQKMSTPCLISNFLFKDEEIGNLIKEYSDTGLAFHLLLNSSEFNNENQFDLFINNLNKFISFKSNLKLTLGFTMFSGNKFSFYKKTLDRLYDDFLSKNKTKKNMAKIRLSMPNPQQGTVDFNDILANIDAYRDLMKKFISWGKDHNTKIAFDCGLFYCLFDDELREYSRDWTDGSKSMGCDSGAFDIFPNGDIINCYPANGLFKSNYFKYNSFIPAMNEVAIKAKLFRSSKELLPEVCQECKYLRKECKGPCLGYYKKPENKYDDIFNT